MKEIDNYILEKLHIGKDYKNIDINSYKEFIEYLGKNDIIIEMNYANDYGKIHFKDKEYPNISVHGVDKNYIKLAINNYREIIVSTSSWKQYGNDIDKYKFDVDKNEIDHVFYTYDNANAIIKLLSEVAGYYKIIK